MSGTNQGSEKRPPEESEAEDKIDQEVEDSFPASDPPSTTPVRGTGKRKPRDETGNL